MVIIGKTVFPPESAEDVGKRFLELPTVPDFMSLKGPYLKSDASEGIQGLELYELDNANLAEGVEFVTNRYVNYFGIPGFGYTIRVFTEAHEALKMIGLA